MRKMAGPVVCGLPSVEIEFVVASVGVWDPVLLLDLRCPGHEIFQLCKLRSATAAGAVVSGKGVRTKSWTGYT